MIEISIRRYNDDRTGDEDYDELHITQRYATAPPELSALIQRINADLTALAAKKPAEGNGGGSC